MHNSSPAKFAAHLARTVDVHVRHVVVGVVVVSVVVKDLRRDQVPRKVLRVE